MNKIKRRAFVIIFLAAFVVFGIFIMVVNYAKNGADWAGFASNDHTHDQGILTSGQVLDKDGVLLLTTVDGERVYHEDRGLRLSTLHAVGDKAGHIGGSAVDNLDKQLMGYNMINGTYSWSGKGRDVYLTVDAYLNEVAWEALNGRSGCVAIMNYQTGVILCMISSPGFDPAAPPSEPQYVNHFYNSTFPPGSIFKLVTAYAAIEELPALAEYSFYCTGSTNYEDGRIICQYAHGELDFNEALAVSCNCSFADLTMQLGAEIMSEYVAKAGLDSSFEVSDYPVAAGSFDWPEEAGSDLGWAGVGQYHDLVNPCAMLRFVSSIANEGEAYTPRMLKKVTTTNGLPLWFDIFRDKERIMDEATAAQLKAMMADNVSITYGSNNFPGLPLCAKSGTAEVAGHAPHAWFTGFLDSPQNPYAFIVLVENGGDGASVAGPIANKVLQAAIDMNI